MLLGHVLSIKKVHDWPACGKPALPEQRFPNRRRHTIVDAAGKIAAVALTGES
jgi:hypothetical protein